MPLVSVLYSCTKSYLPYLKKSIQTIPTNKNIEIIVVLDKGLKSEVKSLLEIKNFRLVELKEKLPNMKKSFCLNLGASYAQGDYLLISDADFLYPEIFWSFILNNFPKKQEVYHFFVARINKDWSSKIMEGAITWQEIYNKYEGLEVLMPLKSYQKVINKISCFLNNMIGVKSCIYHKKLVYDEIFGSINPCLYHRDFWKSLGGYDEKFVGWGGEDDDLERRTKLAGGKNIRIPIVIGHLWHPRIMDFNNYLSASTVYGSKE